MNSSAIVAAADAEQGFEIALLPAFDEIAQAFLKASRGSGHASLQGYLDGRVAVDGAYLTRRAILLAIHDMKEDLEAPLALQKDAHAELASLQVQPAPQLKLYRDIATALLRMEVVMRSGGVKSAADGSAKHYAVM